MLLTAFRRKTFLKGTLKPGEPFFRQFLAFQEGSAVPPINISTAHKKTLAKW
jgi:hypothetical protein